MITITQSVGRGGRAKRGSDVLKIQKLLNKAGAKPKLVTDGLIGRSTIRAIEQFQSAFIKRPDGRIDPGGKSLRRLNGQAAASKTFFTIELRERGYNRMQGYTFHKFDDPSRGYRGGGGRQAVLRAGYADKNCGHDTINGPLYYWYQKMIKGDNRKNIHLSVEGFTGVAETPRIVDFIDVEPVSLTRSGSRINEFTFSFSTFRKYSMY